MQVAGKPDQSAKGRRVALFVAAVAIYWVLAMQIGREYDLSQRTRGLLDMIALGGFAYGLILGVRLWLDRRKDED